MAQILLFNINNIANMSANLPQPQQKNVKTPKTNKKSIHLKKLQQIDSNLAIENCKTFVLGICGGDCAGKKQMIHYMFKQNQEEWQFRQTGEHVSILHQSYFIDGDRGNKYTSKGTNWDLFYKQALSLLIGNEIQIKYQKNGQDLTIKIKPAKLLVIQGSHIFMSNQVTKNLSSLINLRVFIDSDSDIRLSRRVYQDTIENKKDLNWSINNYLDNIKPSYDIEIQPTKQSSDIIIPHFGGGFNDHKKDNLQEYDSNIKNACHLILTHLKEQMKKYEEENSEGPLNK